MTDEDLEKKARGFKWYDILGTAVVAAAAAGFIAGATGYTEGRKGGVKEGNDAGYILGRADGYESGKMEGFAEGLAEGMKAGIAEMQEELPKVTINFVPSLMGERAHDIYISAEQTRNNENVFYQLWTAQNAVFADDGTLVSPVTDIQESVSITGENIDMEYMDTDAGYQLGSWQNLEKTVKESMTALLIMLLIML